MTEPYPLSGSFISEKYGIYIKTRREEDTIRLLHLAIDYGCFTFEGYLMDVFRMHEDGGVWICETFKYPKVTINKHTSRRFCNYYGFEYQEW